MSSRIRILGLLACILLLDLGCQKKTDYLYYSNPNRGVAFEHKIKELSGNADLDILWVIDNSSSMEAHQNSVIANMNSFVTGLVGNKALHWKMGLISTSDGEGPYVGFASNDLLDYQSPNVVTRFNYAVARLGLDGDVYEKEYDPIISVLRAYPDFVRPNAYLAIIIVSDAPEQSYRTTAEFLSELTAIKGDLSHVLVYDFANPYDWCHSTDDPFAWQGSRIQELLTQVAGEAYKLCDPAFGQKVADLGGVVASQVTSPRIALTDIPIVSTLQVLHNGVPIPGGPPPTGYWVYDVRGNSIVFSDLSFAPNPNETVRVTYEVDQN